MNIDVSALAEILDEEIAVGEELNRNLAAQRQALAVWDIVGLLQQFIIKYGQIGIRLPFLAEPLRPTPPLVPASTVLLMIVILLVLPQGLFGRKE